MAILGVGLVFPYIVLAYSLYKFEDSSTLGTTEMLGDVGHSTPSIVIVVSVSC